MLWANKIHSRSLQNTWLNFLTAGFLFPAQSLCSVTVHGDPTREVELSSISQMYLARQALYPRASIKIFSPRKMLVGVWLRCIQQGGGLTAVTCSSRKLGFSDRSVSHFPLLCMYPSHAGHRMQSKFHGHCYQDTGVRLRWGLPGECLRVFRPRFDEPCDSGESTQLPWVAAGLRCSGHGDTGFPGAWRTIAWESRCTSLEQLPGVLEQ